METPLTQVLYVDDEPDIREIVTMALELDGSLSVHCCGSGSEALAWLEQHRPDIILLDVMMPGMDGPATLAKMRANPEQAAIPVVFLTAKALSGEIERFLSLGATAVIAKPFDPMTLPQQLREIWHRHQTGGAAPG